MAKQRFLALGLPPEVLEKYAVELSGGMKQRTVIAISTILNPKILVADEPSSALDVSSQKIVIRLLHDLMEKGFVRAMMFITHELPLLFNVTDDIMVMYAGQIVERGSAEEVIFHPLCPYSKGLMESIIVPEKEMRSHRLRAIPGTPPNLKSPPAGCRFADRCRFAEAACFAERITSKDAGSGRSYSCRFSVNQLKERYAHDDD
jgi:peptide/nickel transport system ATP-binding protein